MNSESIMRWGKRLLLAALVVASLVVLAGVLARDRSEVSRPAMRVEVKRVRGGDAAKLDSDEKLVYAGIRAPKEGEPFADQAAQRNAALVAEREVRLRFDDEPNDRKGRLLAYVFAGDSFVNALLVREGLAYARLAEGERRYAAELLAAQADARRARRGIWSAPSPELDTAYAADPKYGEFHRAACEEVNKMKPQRRVDFASRNDALKEGYAPCTACKP